MDSQLSSSNCLLNAFQLFSVTEDRFHSNLNSALIINIFQLNLIYKDLFDVWNISYLLHLYRYINWYISLSLCARLCPRSKMSIWRLQDSKFRKYFQDFWYQHATMVFLVTSWASGTGSIKKLELRSEMLQRFQTTVQ